MSHSSKIRNLGFLSWSNDRAPLEKLGSEFSKAVLAENRRFTKALDGFKQSRMSHYKYKTNLPSWTYRGFTVEGDDKGWTPAETWSAKDFQIKVWDADIDDLTGLFAGAVPESDGYERFTISIYSLSTGKPTLVDHLKMPCGPQVAWLPTSDLVYLQSSKDLNYDSLWLWNPTTKTSKELYRVANPTQILEIKRLEDGSVAVLENDYETKRLGFVSSKGVHWKAKGADIVLVSETVFYVDQTEKEPIESQSILGGWTVKRSFGLKTLYDRDEKAITTVWGEIKSDSRDPTTLWISDVRYEPYVIDTRTWSLSNPLPYPFTVTYTPEPAPTFVIRPDKQEIKGLLINAYGAYGIPTKAGALVSRWHPLLKAGWAIASVSVPGGGDHTQKWREKGQRRGRRDAIDLLRLTILDLQEEVGVEPMKTVLYGRSAGGLLASSTALMNPGLVGGLYIESPYVDVLRTISNPELPLTLLETKEFGIGTDFIDFVETASWSPMEHIPSEGIPDLFILARADEQDLQVYPYEVLKFIERARGTKQKTGDALKLLQISKGRGHFATTIKTREEDCWLLNKNIGYKYTKMSGLSINTTQTKAAEMLGDLKYGQWRKNRGASRKNRTERKNKTNRANRMNRSTRNRMNRKNKTNRANRKNRSNRNRMNRKNKTNRANRH
uniref:Peptidase S9 prolyl oligopeptidase catalytic domain-containing protein n=1 Tax=viral metagenome TaxID=1070528 RepID=A0A6C0LQW9_9ZZZZ